MLVLAFELEQELWLESALALNLEVVSVLHFPLEFERSYCLSMPYVALELSQALELRLALAREVVLNLALELVQ